MRDVICRPASIETKPNEEYMTSIREQKKKKTRQAIMQAAATLFSDKGFEETSIEELARAAGIGKGTIYGYFQTKSDILQAFCEDRLQGLHEELVANADKETPILQQMVGIYICEFSQLTKNREFARFFMQQIAFPRDVDVEKHLINKDNYFKLLFPLLKKAQERGELRKDIDLLYITRHFYALYLLLISAWFNGMVKTEEAETALETMFRQAMEGIQPRPQHCANRWCAV
jgi:AcrR family transcriptional regulator